MRRIVWLSGKVAALFVAFASAPSMAAEVSTGAAMPVPLSEHVATLLPTGKVLVVGGETTAGPSAGAWLYDPAGNAWSASASPGSLNAYPGATLLLSGKVLVGGGTQVRIYDPVADTWEVTAPMPGDRARHTSTRLSSGDVLVVGGIDATDAGLGALRYSATGATWSPAGTMERGRFAHTASLLPSGDVLVVGGASAVAVPAALSSVERYSPASGNWSTQAQLLTPRRNHTATVLPDGRVVVVGGQSGSGTLLSSTEIYDPGTDSWAPGAELPASRELHGASLMPDGRVVVTGGSGAGGVVLADSIVYDPAANTWQALAALAVPRHSHSSTWLPNGSLLLLGGRSASGLTASVEVLSVRDGGAIAGAGTPGIQGNIAYATILPSGRVLNLTDGSLAAAIFDPADGSWSATGPMAATRSLPSLTLLPSGQVLAAGGSNLNTAERYDETTNTWTPVASMEEIHRAHQAVLLPSGDVLVISGFNNVAGEIPVAERYDPAADTWTTVAPPLVPRHYASATLLPDGRVLLAGGFTAGGVTTHSEIYDPAANTWTQTGAMTHPRNGHMATLLHAGKVLVAGGSDGARNAQREAERYDPMTGSWSTAGLLGVGRENSTITLLPSGRVLVAGGFSSNPSLTFYANVDLYDPVGNRWLAGQPMAVERGQHSAALLGDGRVLLTNGVNRTGFVTSAELFQEGLAPVASLQPQLVSANGFLLPTSVLVASGSGFLPTRDASHGTSNASPSNLPVFQVQRVDNGLTRFVPGDALIPLADTAFTGREDAFAGFPAGPVRVRTWVNGMPSRSIQSTFAVPPGAITSADVTGGVLQAQFAWTHPYTGGAPITYDVTASNGDTFSCTGPCDDLVVPLPPGTYTFAIAIANAAGPGPDAVAGPATVVKDAVAVTVTPASDTPEAGSPVTIAVAVDAATSAHFIPGGSVVVSDGGGRQCTIAALVDGRGECDLTFPATGTVTIQATYAGDALFDPGNGSAVVTVVAPQIDVLPTTLPEGTVAVAYPTTTFTATGGQSPYTFAIADGALPDGLVLSTAGVLSGTPSDSGTFAFAVVATDDNGFSGSAALTLTIAAPTLVLAPPTLPVATAGSAYSLSFDTSGGIAPYAYVIADGVLPAGLTLSPAGVLAGMPSVSGDFAFRVRSSDSSGGTGPATVERDYVLDVNAPGIVVMPDVLPAGQVAAVYPATTFSAEGGTAPYAFVIAAGAPPNGLSLSTAGDLAGTPTASGDFTFTVRATDANDFTGAISVTLNIAAPVLVLAPESLPPATAGVDYAQTFTTFDGIAPYSYNVVQGELPDGLTLTGQGQLGGAATVGGSFPIRIASRDSSGGTGPATVERDYVLVVASPDIVVTPAELPAGVAGAAYPEVTLAAGGGTAPYTYVLASGSLPPGIDLTSEGVVSGTATMAGVFESVISATDANEFIGTRAYVIDIAAAQGEVIVTSSPNPSEPGEAVTLNIEVVHAAAFEANRPAHVVPAGMPSGTVTVSEGATVLATLELDATGMARYTTSHFAPGTHTITVDYSGDAATAPASAQVVQVVLSGEVPQPPQPVPATTGWALWLMLAGVVLLGMRGVRRVR